MLLSDWTDENPETIFSNPKAQSDYYNYRRLTLPNFISATAKDGFGSTVSQRLAWARMNMSPTDIPDVTGAAYTYLLNGKFSPRELDRAITLANEFAFVSSTVHR